SEHGAEAVARLGRESEEIPGLREPCRERADESGADADEPGPHEANAAADRIEAARLEHRARKRDPRGERDDPAEPAQDRDLLEERDRDEDDRADDEEQDPAHAPVSYGRCLT